MSIMIVDMWLQACVFDIVLSQRAHNHAKTREDGEEYFR